MKLSPNDLYLQGNKIRAMMDEALAAAGCVRIKPIGHARARVPGLTASDCAVLSEMPREFVSQVFEAYPWAASRCSVLNSMPGPRKREVRCSGRRAAVSIARRSVPAPPAMRGLGDLIKMQCDIECSGIVASQAGSPVFKQLLDSCKQQCEGVKRSGAAVSTVTKSDSGILSAAKDKAEALAKFVASMGPTVTVPASMSPTGQAQTLTATRIFEAAWACGLWALGPPLTWTACVTGKLGLLDPTKTSSGSGGSSGAKKVSVAEAQAYLNTLLAANNFKKLTVDGVLGGATCGAARHFGYDVEGATGQKCKSFIAPTKLTVTSGGGGSGGGSGGGTDTTKTPPDTKTPATAKAGLGTATWAVIGVAAVGVTAYMLNEDRKKRGLKSWW